MTALIMLVGLVLLPYRFYIPAHYCDRGTAYGNNYCVTCTDGKTANSCEAYGLKQKGAK